MATWPATLPAPTIATYSVRQRVPAIRTDLESGPPRMARASHHYMSVGTIELVVDATQHAAFEQLYQDSKLGTEWIDDVPLDTSGSYTTHRARLTSVERRMIKQPDTYRLTIGFETDDNS